MPGPILPHILAQRHVMDWSLAFVAHTKKARPLISSCADDEKVITIPPSSVDIGVQLTELTTLSLIHI